LEKYTTAESRTEEVISAGQAQKILNTDASEVVTLCQKAHLKPKKDGLGNVYFSKTDIDVLRKVKELYEHTAQIQAKRKKGEASQEIESGNFLTRAKNRLKGEFALSSYEENRQMKNLTESLSNLENSIVDRINSILSEKMDGLDEVVVELIRAKTENETLRQKLNELNRENFNLKNENTSYKSIGLGLYLKKNTDDFVL